ncbi:MAG: periplasmic protein involved in polysaccharide export [Acidobacteriales bacterium]|nr:periplasmic protein involved in polysaccharide export [Terriglobales bacterium]
MKFRFKGNMCAALALMGALLGNAVAQQKTDASDKGAAKAADKSTAAPELKGIAVSPDYVIGLDDILVVNVWREPEVSRQVAVRPDGKISLPLIGELQAAGETPSSLQVRLTKMLSSVIKSPEVTVIVQDIRSQKFNVLGEVNRPGSYQLNKPMTVLDAIALAGGFRDFARPKKMYVLRRGKDGTTSKMAVNYANLLKGTSADLNFELESRDTIVVP